MPSETRRPEHGGIKLPLTHNGEFPYPPGHLKRVLITQLYKRTGRMDEAAHIWRKMAACKPVEFYAISELAKYLEHRERDYPQAKAMIENALNQYNTFSQDERESQLHRLKRLAAKLKTSR